MPKRSVKPSVKSSPAARPDRLPVMGWREWIELPELGIRATKAKVDTGARSSALHAEEIQPYTRAGKLWVRFQVHPLQRDRSLVSDARAPVMERREIRSSSGQVQARYVVRTAIYLGGMRYSIDLTLADRDTMGFRMLLGREAVRGRFVVDPGRSFLVGPKPKGNKKKKTVKKPPRQAAG
jgi:hypothetical protein